MSSHLHRCGFAALLGRPNVGKSTLLNALVGEKASIVSDKVNTTRRAIRAVAHLEGAQVIFVDTPGLHRPRTLLGERLNDSARAAMDGIDVAIAVFDATCTVGKGDAMVARQVGREGLAVLNKADAASASQLAARSRELAEFFASEPLAVSGLTGQGVDALAAKVASCMPEGPPLYPPEALAEMSEGEWVAELVREQLLALVKDELPHSIACRVTEWEPPVVRVEILVERSSQKAIVVGKGGANLKAVGIAAREQMPKGTYLDLFVKVSRDWQRRPKELDSLGL